MAGSFATFMSYGVLFLVLLGVLSELTFPDGSRVHHNDSKQ